MYWSRRSCGKPTLLHPGRDLLPPLDSRPRSRSLLPGCYLRARKHIIAAQSDLVDLYSCLPTDPSTRRKTLPGPSTLRRGSWANPYPKKHSCRSSLSPFASGPLSSASLCDSGSARAFTVPRYGTAEGAKKFKREEEPRMMCSNKSHIITSACESFSRLPHSLAALPHGPIRSRTGVLVDLNTYEVYMDWEDEISVFHQ